MRFDRVYRNDERFAENRFPRNSAGPGRLVGDGAGKVGAVSDEAAWMLTIT
jgi:hypothetical protein